MNLFIAIVIDAFSNKSETAKLPVQAHDLNIFMDIWSHFDPTSSGYIGVPKLEEFLIELAKNHECDLFKGSR